MTSTTDRRIKAIQLEMSKETPYGSNEAFADYYHYTETRPATTSDILIFIGILLLIIIISIFSYLNKLSKFFSSISRFSTNLNRGIIRFHLH